jgi:rare lipoprotein A
VVASWYGPNFHGKPTSSGEPFNMYAFTCAHKDFPFGSRLRVTNISNDRSVVCVVNDRGPFIEGRDLDLSYASAKEIGLVGPGVGRVFIEFIERDLAYVKQIVMQSDRGPFTIQIGSFREPSNAARLKTALGYRYRDVYIMETQIDGTAYYRVRVGRFDTREDIRDLVDRLSEEGYPVLIITYEREA